MALFPMTNAGAAFTLDGPQTVDQYFQGIRTKADFSAAFATLSEGVEYSNGLRLLASGQLSIVDASSGLPASATFVNGLPITSDGKLCVSKNAIATWSNGIAFDAAGAVVFNPFAGASLDLNFAGATALDPRITFTRASGGTYFDSAGVLRSAVTNYIRNNTMQGAVAGTPGTLPTNWSLTATGLTQQVVGVGTEGGISYIDIKLSGTTGSTRALIRLEPTTAISASIGQTWTYSNYVSLAAGSLSNLSSVELVLRENNVSGSELAAYTEAIVPTTAGLASQRRILTHTLSNASTAFVMPIIYLNYASGAAIDVTLRIGLPQLELGAFATSVIPTFGTINSAPRFDHGPVTFQPRGLLIEEQRTNSIRNNTMQGAVAGTPGTLPTNWNIGTANGLTTNVVGTGTEAGIAYVDVQITGTPSGTAYTLFTESATQIAALNSQTWTRSFWCKQVDGSQSNLTIRNLITFRSSAGSALQSSIPDISVDTNFNRFDHSFLASNASIAFVHSGIWISTTAGLAIDITLRIGMPQLELGAFATSVIPTFGTAATRAADVAVMTGTNFSSWYQQNEGTLFAEYSYSATGVSNLCAYSLDNGTANETIVNATATPNIDRVLSSAGGVSQANFGNFNYIVGQVVKRAVAAKLNDAATTANGSAVATDNSYTMPVPTQLTIGAAGYFTSSRINGHIRRIAFFPRRLSDAELQSLTA